MYKIVYNGMFEYIVIKICPKYDTATNMGIFGLPHAFPPLAGHASPVRTATRLIYASLHASCIVERCHRRRRRMCSVAIVNSHEPPAPGHQLPVNDWPPAYSMRNDMGKTSYRTVQNQTKPNRVGFRSMHMQLANGCICNVVKDGRSKEENLVKDWLTFQCISKI